MINQGTAGIIRAIIDETLYIKSKFRDVAGADHADKLRQMSPYHANTTRYALGEVNGLIHALAYTYGYNYGTGYRRPAAAWLDACQAIRHAADQATMGHDSDNTNDTERAEMYAAYALSLMSLQPRERTTLAGTTVPVA